MLEDFTSTPFWTAFYQTPGIYSFEAEVSFILQHYHQIKRQRVEGKGEGILVCDFSYRLDRAYSAVSLDRAEFHAFEAVYQQVSGDSAPPGLLIHLQCSAETQMQRIEARARKVESRIRVDFLRTLNTAIDREVGLACKSMPVLSLDSEGSNFADDADTKERYVRKILERVSEISHSVTRGHIGKRKIQHRTQRRS
jgi:deoxyguanosine kinase